MRSITRLLWTEANAKSLDMHLSAHWPYAFLSTLLITAFDIPDATFCSSNINTKKIGGAEAEIQYRSALFCTSLHLSTILIEFSTSSLAAKESLSGYVLHVDFDGSQIPPPPPSPSDELDCKLDDWSSSRFSQAWAEIAAAGSVKVVSKKAKTER